MLDYSKLEQKVWFMEARPAIALVQTIAEFTRAVVLLVNLPLYESYESVAREGLMFLSESSVVFSVK